MTCSSNNNAFGKTICCICYEDLKPLIEDLQSISICGHVFHELCLQKWLTQQAKKSTCPVCKQKCSQDNVSRLYFQSIGDPEGYQLSQRRVNEEEEDPVVLALEVKKLNVKVVGLSTALERQQRDLKEVNEELCLCKEQVKKEVALKNDALQQMASIQHVLKLKSEDLVRTTSECSKLQDKNMALAKELAALKLVSDLNLDEEEVVKLASLGHGNNSKDTVDVLKKSLVLRNKSYKELMAQCNSLGRGETRSQRKLEKTKQKMKNLKARLRELELALEVKDNEALRALKESSKISVEKVDLNDLNQTSSTPGIHKSSSDNPMKQSFEPVKKPDLSGLTSPALKLGKISSSECHKDLGVSSCKKDKLVIDLDLDSDSDLPKKDNSSLHPPTKYGQRNSFGHSDLRTTKVIDSRTVEIMEEDVMHTDSPSSTLEAPDEIREIPSLLNIRKENSTPLPTLQPGNLSFAGGLIGPDGTSRYLGKWCKRNLTKAPISSSANMQGSSPSTGDLISVGADGRGGRIKVFRNQSDLDIKSSFSTKRLKTAGKPSQHSQGCLQIDHFFVKTERP